MTLFVMFIGGIHAGNVSRNQPSLQAMAVMEGAKKEKT